MEMESPNTSPASLRTYEFEELQIPAESPFELTLPFVVLSDTGIAPGDEVSVGFQVANNQLGFTLRPSDSSEQITRVLRDSVTNEAGKAAIRLPVQLVELAGLADTSCWAFTHGDTIGLVAKRDPQLSRPDDLEAVETTILSRYSQGNYVLNLSETVTRTLPIGDAVWFWVDYFGDNLLFVIETDQSQAPHYAGELAANSSSKSIPKALRVNFPQQIATSTVASDALQQWGRNGTRVYGTPIE